MLIAVLGAGMVGRAIALDLATTFEVTSFDVNEQNLALLQQRDNKIKTQLADLRNTAAYATLLSGFDMVVTAVPGFMGFETLKAVINAGKNVADISFFPEDALQLDALAKEKNVTAIVDCGVAPGMSNWIIGRYNAEMKVDKFEIYVGGLPLHPQPPFLYKAPFSPIDVMEEYTRPARLKENGVLVTKPALTDREMMQFDEVGTLEAFNTDGLRSLLFTMPHIPTQIEKTLRYPGHVDLIVALQQAGFFSEEKRVVNGTEISPLQFTSQLLIDQWKLGETEEELTVMKVLVHGDGQTVEYHLFDKYDAATGISSMARTTGYACTGAVQLMAQQMFTEKGVFPPELIGHNKACFDFVLNHLQQRGVHWQKKA
ncbi:saccharopine dehydrogenase-like NADP-dependent oxidoreductase [Lacibacter cauensis]|uniref:Saccharopine dehydrogenase-like NADP-dependent oxidoreductase n=1 Tax=Lacibacter cauensis TaxID=510947 RepID=A0A562SLR2_9BACT|nr:saccharopine dehydrogenase C-terminal domain-containing protein [Lacibacter cauensis]TWI81636.1 saccharopine dehydrogenase-like NADP-dependent oxidoreductase [Lacibacter cauensis]